MAFSSPNSLSASAPSASSPFQLHLRLQPQPFLHLPFHRSLPLHLPGLRLTRPLLPPLPLASSGDGSNFGGGGGDDDLPSGGGGGDEGEGDDDDASVNRREALFVLAQLGRKLESLPADMAAAVDGGRLPGEIVRRFADLEKSPVFRWLLQFGGFRERLLADDLFLAKVAMECGVGIFTKIKESIKVEDELLKTKLFSLSLVDIEGLPGPPDDDARCLAILCSVKRVCAKSSVITIDRSRDDRTELPFVGDMLLPAF